MSGSGQPLNDDAMAQLHLRYRAPLLSYFQRRVGAMADAEDLTQEVFLRISRRAEVDLLESADGYIFTVAANLLRDRARRAQARAGGGHVSFDQLGDTDRVPALVEDRSPERVLLSRELLSRVLGRLDALPGRTRSIFLLYRLEGLKQREIADLFGISVSAVEKQIVKALQHLTRESE